MSEAYDSSFRKVVGLNELPADKPAVFRAAGATVVLRRAEDGAISAIDGSCLAEQEELSHEERLQKVLDCVAAGAGTEPDEWNRLVERAGLRVKVDDGAVWVCLDGCRGAPGSP